MFKREREKKSTGFRSELLPGKGGKTVIRCGCEKVWLCEVWRMLCVSKLCWCSWALGADDGSWVEPRLLSDSGWEPAAAAGLELVDWPFFRQRPKAALICCCSPVMLLISPVETNQTVTTIHLAWHVSSFPLSSPPPSPPPSISAHSNRVWRHNHSTTSRNLNPTTLKEKITGDCLLASRLVQQNRQTSMILFFLSWKNQRPDNSIHNPSQRNYRKLNKPYQFWFSLPIQRSN